MNVVGQGEGGIRYGCGYEYVHQKMEGAILCIELKSRVFLIVDINIIELI